MKTINDIINESKSKGEWCLWDYKDDDIREILIWKGNGRDQSEVYEIDEDGTQIMNSTFEEVIKYCEDHKDDQIDKWHLDFFNANWNKIKNIFDEKS